VRVTIVTISFNQADYLERTLLSVLDQDYEDIEYIVVDPGSADGSRNIIDRYRSRISKIIYEPDNGPTDGLNRGFAVATGDIYGFLNSDDILYPGAVKRIVEAFRKNPGIDLVSGHAIIIDGKGRYIRRCYSEKGSLRKYAYGTSVLMQPSTFFTAGIFKMVSGFNAENRTNWDGELFTDMRLHGAKFAVINELLSGYRLQPESITSSKKLDDGIKKNQQLIFRKIMGRDWNSWDIIPALGYRILKHVTNPKALVERVLKGPVYGCRTGEVGDKTGPLR
jgi:glycosyltransferase involved in cell wall biosynthesis